MPHDDSPEPPRGNASASGPRRLWRIPRTTRGKAVAGGAGMVAILLVVGLLTVSVSGTVSGGHDGTALATPTTRSDPLPAEKPLTGRLFPGRCGVSTATLDKLVPGAEPDPHCRWSAHDDDGKANCESCLVASGGRARFLDVDVWAKNGSGEQTPLSEALLTFDETDAKAADSSIPMRRITGLGEEAIARYVPSLVSGGGNVVFRYRNVVVDVTYDGRNPVKNRRSSQVPKKEAMNGAMRAATDVAKKLGTTVPSDPEFTPRLTGPRALARVPKPCDMVPEATLDQMAEDPTRSEGTVTLPTRLFVNLQHTFRTCEWKVEMTCCADDVSKEGAERRLTVSVAPIPDRTRPGSGTRTAARTYRMLHLIARARPGFHALAGLGEQAFSGYGEPSGTSGDDEEGRVVFRVRNVLVVVSYSGADDERSMPRKRAVDGAYAVAARAAASLPA